MKNLVSVFSIVLSFLLFTFHLSAQTFQYDDCWGKSGLTIEEESRSNLVVNYSINEVLFGDIQSKGEVMKSVKIPGIFLPNDEGAPDLPGTGRYIAIPQGSNVSYKIVASRVEKLENVNIAPAPEIPLDTENGDLVYEKNMDIYSKDKFYPENPVIISSPSKLRGIDVVMLGITPFQYNPVTKELLVYRDMKIEIVSEGGNGQIGETRLRSRWWDPIIYSDVLNKNIIPAIDYNQNAPSNRATGYEYVIIIPDNADFLTWAETIKQWRTLQGIKTGVVTITEIGGNTVANIENYIDNAYYNWDIPPAAVLLLGDYSTGTDGITSQIYAHPAGYPDFVSDNKFADVDGDDLPDIIFARITANDAAQLNVMISKFMDYEQNPPTTANFYNNPITALGWQTERWFQICSETIGGYMANVLGKQPVRINAVYSGNPSSDPWSTAPNTATVLDYFGPNGLGYIPSTPQELGGFTGGTSSDVINAINNGSFLLQHRDHGYYGGWGEPAFNTSSINYLNNVNNQLPFIFSINCQTGAFHRSTESFAEKFHRYTYNGQNSGALGIIAATEVSYSFVNDTYVWGVFDNMFPDFMPSYGTEFPVSYAMPAFGNAAGKHFLYQSSWPYNTSSKQITYRLFHHHGDAFLTLYTEEPQNLTVAHDSEIQATATSFTVTADAGSFIALTVDGTIVGTGDGTGNPLSIPISSPGNGSVLKVTVTKQNYFRYSADVNIISGGLAANFTADLNTLCVNGGVNYTDQSAGESINSWVWSFPGGSPASYNGQFPPSITYQSDGVYDVTLTVSDGVDSDSETKTGFITITPLIADFNASSQSITIGEYVTFSEQSSCAETWVWTFAGGTPQNFTGQNPPPVYYNEAGTFNVSLTVSNGAHTDIANTTIAVTEPQYCNSNGNSLQEWIANVNIDGNSHASGSSGSTGYQDFTSTTFTLDAGGSYSIILTPDFNPRSKFEYWKIWIDFNGDADFFDANEEVFVSNKSKSTVSGTITIPAGINKTTRMRVSMKRSASATPCEAFDLGEVEDYTVVIGEPVPQAPVAEFTSDKTNVAPGETVQFTDQSINNPTSWMWSFPGGDPTSSNLQNPTVVYNTIGTYDVTLTASNTVGTSDPLTKTAYIVVDVAPPASYCEPSNVNNSSDYINLLTIGSTTHNSGQGTNGFTYYNSPSFTFAPGQTYGVTLQPFNDKNRNFWRIWIDFNNDSDFDDSDETLLVANNKKGTFTSSISIPSYVTGQMGRMRITMKTGGSPSSCEDGFNGEVEDYNVNIEADDHFLQPVTGMFDMKLYPNPATDILNIYLNGFKGEVAVVLYSSTGMLIDSFTFIEQDNQIIIDDYPKGLYYITAYDGVTRTSKKIMIQ